MRLRRFRNAMPDVGAFDGVVFLGLARGSKRDPYRLSLFAEHLAEGEQALVLLPVHGGTLLVTDRRLLELRAHLEAHGAWNVKEFRGYEVRRETSRAEITDLAHRIVPGPAGVADAVVLVTAAGPREILVSRGPEATLSDDDYRLLLEAVLVPQPK